MDDLRHTAKVLLRRNNPGLIDLWILHWNHSGRCHPFDFDAFNYGIVPTTCFDMEAAKAAMPDLALEAVNANRK